MKANDKLEFKGEIYGRIWAAITWVKEEREYQRLANALFMAAKEDNHQSYHDDNKLPIQIEYESEAFDQLSVSYPTHLYKTSPALDEIIRSLSRDENQFNREEREIELKTRLYPEYKKLQHSLNEIEALGISKSSIGSIAKTCKNCLKSMITTVISVCSLQKTSLKNVAKSLVKFSLGEILLEGKEVRKEVKGALREISFVKSEVKRRANLGLSKEIRGQ